MTQVTTGKDPRDIFVGRVEEQKQFRAAVSATLKPPKGETLPYVFLLYGDGGIGKTTLARRFAEMAAEEKPFDGKTKCLWVDWEAERTRSAALRVGREFIAAEAVFDTFYTVAERSGWGADLDTYRGALKKRQEAEIRAGKALRGGEKRDDWAAVRGASAAAIARILRAGAPVIGQVGEDLSKALLEAGINVAAEQAQGLYASLEEGLRAELGADQYAMYLNPREALARALAQDLKRIAGRRALLVVLDTYEIVDRADPWLRLLIQAAGPRLVWVLSGRNNLRDSRAFGKGYFRGYTEDWPRRLVAYDVAQLALEDVKAYFAEAMPKRPLGAEDTRALRRATRGIPLALAQAAEMWAKCVPLAEIVGDTDEATPGREIVSRMTGRYLLHVVTEEDRRALYALTLAKGDLEVLDAMLQPEDRTPFDLPALLRRLERDYASVYAGQQRLHDEQQAFFLLHLRAEQQRTSEVVRDLLMRGQHALRGRKARIEDELPRLEDHHADEDWLKAAVDLADLFFWDQEEVAWPWLLPLLVESLAYSRDLRHGLLEVAGGWEKTLSARGRRRLEALRAAEAWFPTPEEEDELLRELERAATAGLLVGAGEQERRAILAWQRGRWLAGQGRSEEALAAYEQARRRLPDKGEWLRQLVGEAFDDLSERCLWPQGASDAVPSATGLQAAQQAAKLLPEQSDVRYNLGLALAVQNRCEEAITAYKQAIALDEEDETPWIGLGSVYSDQERYEDAIAAYKKAIALDETYATPWYGLGYVYSKQEQYEEAIAAYKQAIALDEGDTDPWNGLGNVYSDQERYEDAIAAYKQAIALDEKFAYPWNGLGSVYSDQERYEEAIAAYKQAIALDEKFAYPWYGLGNVWSDQERYEDAIAAYKKAIALDETYADPWNGLGNVYRGQERYEEAIAAYKKAIALDEKFAYPWNGLGNVYSDQGRYEEAIAAYKQAIALDEKDADPWIGLGSVYSDQERYEDAIAAYKKAVALDETYATPWYGLGNVWSDQERYEDAIAAYKKAIALDETYADSWNGLGNVYRDQERYEEAIAAYKQAIALDEKFAYPWIGLGNVYRDQERYEDAIAAYKKAIALDEEDTEPWNGLGNIYSDQERYEDAIAAYKKAVALGETYATPWYGLGYVYSKQERYEEAIAAYKKAIALDEEDTDPWNGLGNVYRDQERYEEAIAAYKKAIALDETYAYPWSNLGNVYSDQGRHEEAIAAYKKAIALDENDATPWNGLGNVYRDQERYEEAIAAYKQAIALDEKFAYPWNGLGNVYSDQGRYEEAIAAYKQAIALDEKDADAWHGLGQGYTLQGELAQALAAFRRAAALAPEDGMRRSSLVGILRRLGREEEAAEQERLAQPLMARETEYNRACFGAICGNTDEALRLLQVALEKGQASRAWAAQDPDFESLHGDPRFESLVRGEESN